MTAYLADTNVVIRWVLPHDPLAPVVRSAIKQLIQQGHTIYVGVQNLVEFWSVATRPPVANGLGMTDTGTDDEGSQSDRVFISCS